METIVDIISNVGFPIAAFLLMWYQNTQMTKSLESNTQAITKLSNKIDELTKGGVNND